MSRTRFQSESTLYSCLKVSLAKWLSVRLRTKWFWVRVQLQSKFDQLYNRIVKRKMNLPSSILAFKLLKCANLTTDEHMIVLTGMNYDEPNTLYKQAKKSLKKYNATKNSTNTAMELDSAYLA